MKNVPKKCSILFFLMTLLLAGCGQKATHPPEIDIHSAVATGEIASVRQHIDAGSNLDEPDSTSGNTPLMNAILFGQREVGQLLIENGVKLDARSNDGSTALINAAFLLIRRWSELSFKKAQMPPFKIIQVQQLSCRFKYRGFKQNLFMILWGRCCNLLA